MLAGRGASGRLQRCVRFARHRVAAAVICPPKPTRRHPHASSQREHPGLPSPRLACLVVPQRRPDRHDRAHTRHHRQARPTTSTAPFWRRRWGDFWETLGQPARDFFRLVIEGALAASVGDLAGLDDVQALWDGLEGKAGVVVDRVAVIWQRRRCQAGGRAGRACCSDAVRLARAGGARAGGAGVGVFGGGCCAHRARRRRGPPPTPAPRRAAPPSSPAEPRPTCRTRPSAPPSSGQAIPAAEDGLRRRTSRLSGGPRRCRR